MIKMFLAFGEAVELVTLGAAVSSDLARRAVIGAVRSDAVRLSVSGAVFRWTGLPEVVDAKAARNMTRDRSPVQRYNPHKRDRGARPSPARQSLPDPVVLLASYGLHLGDLEKALLRDFDLDVALQAAVAQRASAEIAEAAVPATRPTPIKQMMDMFRELGGLTEFADLPKDQWRPVAAQKGLHLTTADFDTAWKVACDQGWVVALKGAPKLDRQSKRAVAPAVVPICAHTPSSSDVAVRKATGT